MLSAFSFQFSHSPHGFTRMYTIGKSDQSHTGFPHVALEKEKGKYRDIRDINLQILADDEIPANCQWNYYKWKWNHYTERCA